MRSNKSANSLGVLLSSVVQQLSESRRHDTSTASLDPRESGRRFRRARRPSRIRSWIAHRDLKDSDDSVDNSLHFQDDDDDDDDNYYFDDSADSHSDIVIVPTGAGSNTKSSLSVPFDETLQPRDSHHPHLRRRSSSSSSSDRTPEHAGSTSPLKMHIAPDEIKMREEEEAVDALVGLMGEDFDREVVRRILRKYDANVDKAAGALLEGERVEEGEGVKSQNQGWAAATASGGGSGVSSSGVGGNGGGGGGGGSSSSTWPMMGSTTIGATQSGSGSSTRSIVARPNTPVIDLTFDEDDQDLQRAMQESMNVMHHAPAAGGSQQQTYPPSYAQTPLVPSSQSQQSLLNQIPASQTQQGQQGAGQSDGPVFGPSERPPDPSWAMVPSNQNESNDANYLQNLNRAIEASLETMGDMDALEPFPVEQQLRRDGCPVVLRPSMYTMVYAASIIQGLFYIPQVKERTACWRPRVSEDKDEVITPSMNDLDYKLWALSEIFTHMDLARLCDLNVDKRLPAFDIESWERPAQPPGELSRTFYIRISNTLEKAFIDQFARDGQPLPKPRLLHFQYGSRASEPGEVLRETSVVPIDVNGGESNDLIGQLSAQLSKPHSEPGKQSVIIEPSEVVAFELVRSSSTTTTNGGGTSDRKPFTYPKSIYLDQFLRENVALAQGKRGQRQALLDEAQRLVLHKKTLTHFDGKDTLKNLRSVIFYYENVANAEDDLERGASLQTTTRKLKDILTTMEGEIKATEENIGTLRARADTLLDCEELQQLKYDLRVVFVHDGLYGRKHLYSYVQDKSCWWKIADSLIEKVTEEVVLNDQAGLHLGAGPYLLFYSRAMPESEGPVAALPWMDEIKDDVKTANREFLSQLPPELVGDIVVDEEDVSSFSKGGTSDRMDVC